MLNVFKWAKLLSASEHPSVQYRKRERKHVRTWLRTLLLDVGGCFFVCVCHGSSIIEPSQQPHALFFYNCTEAPYNGQQRTLDRARTLRPHTTHIFSRNCVNLIYTILSSCACAPSPPPPPSSSSSSSSLDCAFDFRRVCCAVAADACEKLAHPVLNPYIGGSSKDEYKLAQSGDATCNGLDSAEVISEDTHT